MAGEPVQPAAPPAALLVAMRRLHLAARNGAPQLAARIAREAGITLGQFRPIARKEQTNGTQ
jgi:hypothetical protein